jgi:hypothetical protein
MTDREPIFMRPPQGRGGVELWAHDPRAGITTRLLGPERSGGQPEPPADPPTNEPAWDELVAEVAEALANLRPDQFLILEYHPGGDPEPYAQSSPEMGGYYCELVSEEYLPGDQWPIDDIAIRRQGWAPPDPDTPNWWTYAETAEEAAHNLVDGLRHGRRCPDLSAYTWCDGTFPGGGGGGEPLPKPHEQAA